MALDSKGSAPEHGIHWRVLGQGPKKALALHCNLGHSSAFRGIAAELNDLFTIEAPDMPGHGRSVPYRDGVPTGQWMLDAILDQITEPVDVIGHSYGGLIGLRLALLRPELVRSLSLYEPVTMLGAQADAPETVAGNAAHMDRVVARYEAGDSEGAVRLFVEEWGDGRPWEDLPAEMRAQFAGLMSFVIASQRDVLEDLGNIMPRLGQIGVPTVVMDGARSPAIMKPVCDYVARNVQNGRRVTVDGAGHMGAISHAAVVAAEVRRLVTS